MKIYDTKDTKEEFYGYLDEIVEKYNGQIEGIATGEISIKTDVHTP